MRVQTVPDGFSINPEELERKLTYNGDGKVDYIEVTTAGRTYRQTFTYLNGNNSGISAWVRQYGMLVPVLLTAPEVIGTPTVGVASAFTASTWSGADSVAHKWQLGTDAAGAGAVDVATTATYSPVAGDVGKFLGVEETATNAAGSTFAKSAIWKAVQAAITEKFIRSAVTGQIRTPSAGGYAGNTWHQTQVIPVDGFTKIKIGMPTNYANDYSNSGVRVTAAITDGSVTGIRYLLDASDGNYVPVTWGGAAFPSFAKAEGDTVRASKTTWSDEINLTSVPRADGGKGCFLIVRAFYPAGFVGYGAASVSIETTAKTKSAKLTELLMPAIFVHKTGNSTTDAAFVGSASSGTFPLQVAVVSSSNKKNVLVVGDSTYQGFYGDGVVSAFDRAAFELDTVAVTNKGWTGALSEEYIKTLNYSLSDEQYDVVVYEACTPNDFIVSSVPLATAQTRLDDAIAAIRATGAKIILPTPLPVTTTTITGTQQTFIDGMNTYIRGKAAADIIICDFATLHGGTFGVWASGMNKDQLHQNEAGTNTMKGIIKAVFQQL